MIPNKYIEKQFKRQDMGRGVLIELHPLITLLSKLEHTLSNKVAS
jgi:hypothetical protein